jgi:hypothetical protein
MQESAYTQARQKTHRVFCACRSHISLPLDNSGNFKSDWAEICLRTIPPENPPGFLRLPEPLCPEDSPAF